MDTTTIFLIGLVLGIVIGWLLVRAFSQTPQQRQKIEQLEEQLRTVREGESTARIKWESLQERYEEEKQRLTEVRKEMENAFKAMATDIAHTNATAFLQQANVQFKSLKETSEQQLDEKKKLIDKNLLDMKQQLGAIHQQSTELKASIDTTQNTTKILSENTAKLREILSSSQQRGQWGERMVEDILQIIGLVENVNYSKQSQVESGQRPDFTFFLPKEKKLNMDVKFPLAHYEEYLTTDTEEHSTHAKNAFLQAVRKHIKTVHGREYINPSEGTLDYVILFIPNESIYGFIHQEDAKLIDHALAHRVLLCSPLTLYAVLSLIHQASQNFTMNERASEVMELVSQFREQWKKYVGTMDKLGNRIEGLSKDYNELTLTRARALQRPLDKIENISLANAIDATEARANTTQALE